MRRAEVETDDFLVDGPKLGNVVDAPGAGLAEGTQIGTYRLISEIGRGGMGTVWLAERADGMMKRRVALKLPRAVWGDAFAERLAREREILASLEYERISRVCTTRASMRRADRSSQWSSSRASRSTRIAARTRCRCASASRCCHR